MISKEFDNIIKMFWESDTNIELKSAILTSCITFSSVSTFGGLPNIRFLVKVTTRINFTKHLENEKGFRRTTQIFHNNPNKVLEIEVTYFFEASNFNALET